MPFLSIFSLVSKPVVLSLEKALVIRVVNNDSLMGSKLLCVTSSSLNIKSALSPFIISTLAFDFLLIK